MSIRATMPTASPTTILMRNFFIVLGFFKPLAVRRLPNNEGHD